MKVKLLMTMTAFMVVSACTWVNENPASESVAIVMENNLPQCQQLGTIDVRTKYSVGIIKRGAKKVQTELKSLARNEALKINANTIVPVADPVEGKQQYLAYSCPR